MSEARAWQAIAFDLDGTLVDSSAAIAASLNHARIALGHAPLDLDAVRARVGWGLAGLLQRSFPAAERVAARDLYGRHHIVACASQTQVLPGVRTTLDELGRMGVLRAVVTNKPAEFTDRVLAALELATSFELVVGASPELALKPDPAMLRHALRRLEVVPERALYVGDMTIDAATARAAGVRFVAVATGAVPAARLLETGAEAVLTRLDELLPLVRSGRGA